MPILTLFGGMTQHIAIRQNCAGRSLAPRRPAIRISSSSGPPQAATRTPTHHFNRQPPVCDTNPRLAARRHDTGMCNARNCAAKRRYLRRLAQSATPTAAEDKFNEQSAQPSTAKKYPTPVRASDTLIIIYRETTRGTTAEYPPPQPNRSRPPHWDPWRASAGSSKDWRPGPPSAIRAQP